MNLKEMEVSQLEERKLAIAGELDAEGADLDALEAEARAINAELEARKAEAAKKAEVRQLVNEGAGEVIEKYEQKEERKMETVEVRNSAEYIDAYANYIKTGKDEECRALLSTNGTDATSPALTGYVPVPELVDARIRTAWERSEIMNLVHKTYLKGNVKVGFELSASGAVVHKEGRAAPDEEVITLGIVEMKPESIKKWITISDEALDLSGAEFLNYIYDELTYRIAKKAEEELIGIITALPDTATSSSVSAATITSAPALGLIAEAMGNVIGTNLTVVMNRATWAAFKAKQYAANFALDIFEGQRVVFSDALPSYAEAVEDNDGDVYAIVGDFAEGAQANFPNGDQITIKVDNLSLAEKDLVKFVGREFVGLGAVADKRFCLIAAPTNP